MFCTEARKKRRAADLSNFTDEQDRAVACCCKVANTLLNWH